MSATPHEHDPHAAGRYAHHDMDQQGRDAAPEGEYTDRDVDEVPEIDDVGDYTDHDVKAAHRAKRHQRGYTASDIPEEHHP